MDKESLRETLREMPEYRDGHMTDAQLENIVEYAASHEDEILKDYINEALARELLRMVNCGEAEYDPTTDHYRLNQR